MNAAQLAIDGLDQFGEYVSTHFEAKAYTNTEQMIRARALASVLKEYGIQPGDRVVVMLPTSPEVSASFHAIWRIGAVIIPLMPQLVAREVRFIVEDSGAKLVITSPGIAPTVAEATRQISTFERILVFGETTPACGENVAPIVATASPLHSVCDRKPSDLAVLVYTSGTTSHPKGVMLSHDNLISNARSVASLFNLPPRHHTMMVLPMSHVYGILLMNLGALMGGVSTMLKWFDAETVLRTIEQFRVERCSLVPTMLIGLINHPLRERYDTSSLRVVAAGSAPLSEEVRLEFERLFGCRVSDGYGQSEATCAVTAYPDEEAVVAGSVGRAIPGVQVCIQDDSHRPLPAGQTGEICIRGPNVMLGYWNNEAATRETIVDGWLHSGDVGHMDEQGYIFITDRKKDMIIKGGENISPREIEEIIYRHPAVAEVAVFGVPDPKFQEDIAAVIVRKPDAKADAEELRQHAGLYVTKFKIPRHVVFRDQLPKNSNGKVLKRTLRQQWNDASDES